MLLIQSIIVYTGLLFIMYCCANLYSSSGQKWYWAAIPIIAFSFIFGTRYVEGRDYFNYVNLYEIDFIDTSFSDIFTTNYEIGFSFITILFLSLGIPTYIWMTVFSFLQIFLIHKTFKDEDNILQYVYLTLILTGTAIITFTNIIRQEIALCFFLYAMKYLTNKNLRMYFIFWLLAFSFHKSAIIILPLGFIWYFKDTLFTRPKLQLVSIIVCFLTIFIPNYFEQILNFAKPVIALLSYDNYEEFAIDAVYQRGEIGPSLLIGLIVNCIIVGHSNRIKSYFDSKLFNMIYDLYIIGICCLYLFHGNMMLARITQYFHGCAFIIYAYSLMYFKNLPRTSPAHSICTLLLTLSLLSNYFGLFYKSTQYTSLYVSVFQEDLYYLKDKERDALDLLQQ